MRLRILSMIGLAQLLLCVTCQVRSATPDWSVHVILTSGKNMNAVIDHVTAEALYLHSQTETTEVHRGGCQPCVPQEEQELGEAGVDRRGRGRGCGGHRSTADDGARDWLRRGCRRHCRIGGRGGRRRGPPGQRAGRVVDLSQTINKE